MTLSLAQLLTVSTEAESLASILSLLDGLGFSATSWQSGSLQLSIMEMLAKLHADFTSTRVTLTQARYNDTATDAWLDLLSDSGFDNRRFAAVATEFTTTLTDSANVGPFTITVSELVAQDPDGKTYRNTSGGTLTLGGSLPLTFKAEVAGAVFPASVVLATPLAGVPDPGSLTLTVSGADAEKDPKLKTRNRAKWSTLAYGAPQDAYIAWALSADASVTRVYVDDLNPRGAGTIDVYIAGAAGALPGSVVTTVTNYIQARRPIGANVLVLSALSVLVNVTGTIYTLPSYNSIGLTPVIEQALRDMFDALPVGGAGGTVQLASIYATLMSITGIVNVHLTAPLTDVVVGATQVPVPSAAFVFVAVG